ncbi:hypothetical protein MSAN_01600300 [Mycena sanguinolenta]|uniref:Uncharacterized protein n=1 Tax=Mycena sanguinolenta TaxID=230812 RepID=A0A8H6Y3D2_9AGAR|nr:hypothetical protein MSAN_01600300 [Mycena sanguinolenta]
MSSHSPTAADITITLSTLQDSYQHADEDEIDKERAVSETPTSDKRPLGRQSGFAAFYRSASWVLGFREKYSLLNCFIWGGALIGICLARSPTLNPSRISHFLVPGTVFSIQLFTSTDASFQVNGFRSASHCSKYLSLSTSILRPVLGGIGAVFQFIPAIRRSKVLLHRINGYSVLFCLVAAMICGSFAARRAFGGEINAQGAYYVQALLIISCAFMGFNNVKKDTRRHRKWMLRMVAYFGSVLTARLIALPTRSIITLIGTYYSIFRCDEVINLIRAPETIQGSFPQCNSTDATSVFVAVHASVHDPPLYVASAARVAQGLSLWIATVIHILAVEFYIYQTDAANQVRLNFALEPRDFTQK